MSITSTKPTETYLSGAIFAPDVEPPLDVAIFEGFLLRDDVTVWLGREKHRKTNLVLQFVICAALGRPFLNFRFAAPEPLKVVYVDYESKTRSLWERYQAICRAMGLTGEDMQRLKENLHIIEVRKIQKKGREFPRFPLKTPTAKQLAFWQGFSRLNPADLYIFDPMRCFHASDENDSNIEQLLTRLRQFFPNSAVIIPHHMRKQDFSGKAPKLLKDMRGWSDGGRGSVAIKAHSDVIVCQERKMVKDEEVVYLGAFMKDGPDVNPMAMKESDAESFYWQVVPDVSAHLWPSFEALRKAGGQFADKGAAASVLQSKEIPKATAYRHVTELANLGLLSEEEGKLVLRDKGILLPCLS